VGICISFLVRKRGLHGCRIFYQGVRDYARADEKSDFLTGTPIWDRKFAELESDDDGNWFTTRADEYLTFLPIADRATKSVQVASQERAIFRLYSLGISTNRDEWLYDRERCHLAEKIDCLITEYDRILPTADEFPDGIKWSRNLKRRLRQKRREQFDLARMAETSYRPYTARWLYQSDLFIDEAGSSAQMFPKGQSNSAICFSDVGSRTDYCVLAISGIADLHFGAAVDAYQQVPRFRFTGSERIDNVTDWALDKFRSHYEDGATPKRPITKDAIFYYVYSVLHDPVYREKYAPNLKRDFPRIPFHADFWRWADWGERLMALHVDYKTVEPWPLSRIDVPDDRARKAGLAPRALLRADKIAGAIVLDTETQLTGVPATAWDYRLGNRSALEWVLDQHKQRTPRDPTIRERFNTYRFADYKEKVIDLLGRVTRVSVETIEIVAAMRKMSASQ
jgi:predicted helicase